LTVAGWRVHCANQHFIFLDANGNGKQAGDKGMSEVTVEMIQDEKVIANMPDVRN